MYTKEKILKKTTKPFNIKRDIDLKIVNGLDFNLNCQVEMEGNQMTIWITKLQEK